MAKSENTGGCPTLTEQASNRHAEGELRIDLEMGKLVPRAVKHFIKLFARMEKGDPEIKVNQQLVILDKVFKHNKEYRTALAAAMQESTPEYEEEEEEFTICLTSEDTDTNKTLN